jgi:Cd2+/Zn2+-exporting ATPase
MPVAKASGSEVYAGSLNELGALEIKASKVGEATVLGQIERLVKEAEENRAPIVRTADRYAKYFTPFILGVAAIVYLITRDTGNALTVLIVACPCALVIATPTAIIAGIANGARQGILIKGGARLELAGNINAIALDKTGTITLGAPKVIKVVPFGDATERVVLETAAVAEKLSEHPLGKAVIEKAREYALEIPDADEFSTVPGQGVVARCNGRSIVIGTSTLLGENSIEVSPEVNRTAGQMEEEGLTVLLVASDRQIIGLIGLADIVRDEVRQTVKQLETAGVKKIVMLTGDNPEVAKNIAKSVGIGEWQARLMPQQKVDYIKSMQQDGYKVAMVGDGINDAPALAQADLGIAMGITGTDVSMDTADIVLMTGDALKAAEAINLGRKTLRLIKQNLAFALVFNLIGIFAAATGVLSPIGAALFHNFGSVAVVVNSARLAAAKIHSNKRV